MGTPGAARGPPSGHHYAYPRRSRGQLVELDLVIGARSCRRCCDPAHALVLSSTSDKTDQPLEAVGMMKGLSFGIALAATVVAGRIPVYSQIKPGQSINSPFTTYEDADLIDPGAFSIGQNAFFVRTAGGNPLAAEPDNSYVGLKLLLGPGGRYRPALAVKPTLELLWGDASGPGHAHFMLPLILQKDIRLCDLALTAGYITRGVAFGALKCEWNITERIAPLAVVQSSRMTKDLRAISDLGWNRTEVRGSAGLSINATPRW